MVLRICAAIVLLGSELLLAEDELIAQAKSCAKAFALEAEFGLDNYLMTAEISADATPQSELLFTASASMEILQYSNVRLDRFECRPKILDDDRVIKNKVKGSKLDPGPFARMENWENLKVGEKAYSLRDRNGKRVPPVLSGPADVYMQSINTGCMKPFDWPIHGPSSFHAQNNEHDFYKHTFGLERVCVFAERKGELLESHWIKPGPAVIAIRSVFFRENLPVSSELFLFGRPIDPKKYDLKNAVSLVKTETRWHECGGTFVPKSVVSKITETPGNPQTVLLVVKMKVSSEGDEDFEGRKQEINRLVESIESNAK